jgi:hypothetical protein
MESDETDNVAIYLINSHMMGVAEADCARRYLRENALQIHRRA